MMEPRISLVTLGVMDLSRACAFYEALGWRVSAASTDEVVFFQANGLAVAIYDRAALAADAGVPDEGAGFCGMALAHNARSREEVDAIFDDAIQAGAEPTKPPEDTFWGGYSAYFADPDGHLWEIAWNPHFPLDNAGNLRLPD
jgi:predicted lactoylglutathione lyase